MARIHENTMLFPPEDLRKPQKNRFTASELHTIEQAEQWIQMIKEGTATDRFRNLLYSNFLTEYIPEFIKMRDNLDLAQSKRDELNALITELQNLVPETFVLPSRPPKKKSA